MTTDMVGLISPQITSCLLNQQSSLPSPEKVKKQSQERPLMANEKNDFILNCDFMQWLYPSKHKILEFQVDGILTSLLLALEVCGDLCALLKGIYSKPSGKEESQNSSQPVTGLLKVQGPILFCTVSQR